MSVRSIKLKLKTKTGPDSILLRKGLWKTHEVLNQGIAYYMNWLILMRQDSYVDETGVVHTKEEIQNTLLEKIKEQQLRNKWHGKMEEDKVLSSLRKLYELIVPSAVGENGDSQMSARKFLSPLVDQNSQGGEGTAKSGRKPRWQKMKEEGNPAWEEEFKKDQEKKSADPTTSVLSELKNNGLKPLFPLFTQEINGISWLPMSRGYVRTWDRDAFQQSIERLLSWESWNRRVREEKQTLEQKINEFQERHLMDSDTWLIKIRQIEKEREKEITQTSFAPKEGYLITRRAVRGWDKVYDKWNKITDASDEELFQVVADIQTKMKGKFGDPALFRLLAKQEYRDIWIDNSSRLLHIAAFNVLQKKLNHAKDYATLTFPDPIRHPLWIRYDARGGNIHSYTIFSDKNGNLTVHFQRMIWPSEAGWIEKEGIEVELAPSKQFSQQITVNDNKSGKQEIEFSDYSSGKKLKGGELIGSKIQFDRKFLENHQEEVNEGNIGSVFLNVGVEVSPLQEMLNGRLRTPIGQAFKQFPAEWVKVIDFKPKELKEFINQASEDTKVIGIQSLTAGIRIMSIDMGLRTSAAVSIFEVAKQKPTDEKHLYYEIKDTDLFAVHQRSFLLNLPGEKVSNKVREQREKRYKERQFIRSQIRFLASVLQLNNLKSEQDRKDAIKEKKEWIEKVNKVNKWPNDLETQWINLLKELEKKVNLDEEDWKELLVSTYQNIEPVIGELVSKWRRSFSDKRKGIAGISMWNIEELENTRSLLISWSKRSRFPGQVKSIDPKEKVATNLLKHIQNVKDDRLKQMANLIVMTALGYKYNEKEKQTDKRWIEAYPACQVILFEDLTRYGFNMDRSRKENSQLMKWGHRGIPKIVQMQGEVYGLLVGDVNSSFTSRFHAKTGAPGLRCHPLTEEELSLLKDVKAVGGLGDIGESNGELQKNYKLHFGSIDEEYIAKLIDKAHLVKPGTLIPKEGGEVFVSLSQPNGRLVSIHADINAAQNLQRRFWNHNSEIFRVSCKLVKMDDGEYYIPKYTSEKFKKSMGKGRFEKINDSEVYKWINSSKMRIKDTSTDELIELENMEEFEQALEEAQEIQDSFKTMFRDPSGFFFRKDQWLPQKEFWGRVKKVLYKHLLDSSF